MTRHGIDSISFNGSLMGVGTSCGYGYAAVELINAWQRQKVPVWWAGKDSPIAFSFSQPLHYEWQREDQLKIGYTPWESMKLPFGWVDKMNEMDEVWTTSTACRDWFVLNGVKRPMRVLHHGINRQHFPAKLRKLNDDEVFRFLHIGEPADRKGGEYVYEAFVDAFGASTKVSLTLKGKPRFVVDAPNVHVIPDMLSQEDLLKLYHDHHAFVYPTNGEGFGLLPFQAAATGMPTFVTDWSGPVDFMQYCWPIRVEELKEAHYEPHEGKWAIPSMDSIKMQMEYIVDSPGYYFHHALNRATMMDTNWSWDAIAKQSLKWFEETLEKK
jgi:glycosyltransferase involved in cell wall biosynthesis